MTSSSGIPANGLILAPETNYRQWLLQADNGFIGFTDFRTPSSGTPFTIPAIHLQPPVTPDTDGDGLSNDAEFIIGTDPLKADTDGDGISDGAALALGLDPGAAARTGIIGSTDTPGIAVDICTLNDIAVVADSERGVSVFNVFNRMVPLIIAQVETPGPAVAVACSGDLIAVAVGSAGLAVIDISTPPNARIVAGVAANAIGGGKAQAVATFGDLAFVGTDAGWLAMVELERGLLLQRVKFGERIEDLAVEGEVLYAYVDGKLRVIPFAQGLMQPAGSVDVSAGINEANGRGRLFVGGGVAYAVHRQGYYAVDVSNPLLPQVLLNFTTSQFGWKHMVLNGSGLMIAATSPNSTFDGPHDIDVYSLTNAGSPGRFETTFVTPGVARAVALFNGLAYVVDDESGLEVISYLAYDTLGRPPTGMLTTSSTDGTVIEGGRVMLRASVADDVQVRNVEFRIDGQFYVTDGNFPFEVAWRAPTNSVGRTVEFMAVVSDTGINRTNIGSVRLTILPDTQPPTLSISQPTNNQIFFEGDAITLDVSAFDNTGVASLEFKVDGQPVVAVRESLTSWAIPSPLGRGTHQLSVIARDYSGQASAAVIRSFVVKGQAISAEFSLFNFESPKFTDAVSAEFTLFNSDSDEFTEVVTTEFSLFNSDTERSFEAIAPEFSVFNFGVERNHDAVSAEFSLLNEDGTSPNGTQQSSQTAPKTK